MGSDPKMLTTLRMTTDKLSFKRLSSLKLPTAFPAPIPKEKASTMSLNDQVFAEEGKDLVFGPRNSLPSHLKAPSFYA